MCGPIELIKERRRVVIAGAGPAGLLCASLLLAKNKDESSSILYDVTLVDNRRDFGSISKEELAKSFRSWMLGLTDHGIDALRELPELYNKYVMGAGIFITEINIYLGKRKITQSTKDDATDAPEAYIVDRNYIVAAIARYLKDMHGENDENYNAMYLTSCQYVDYEKKQVLTRNSESGDEKYIPYDLLIGCDGVRSTIREVLIKRHTNFSCKIEDIFQEFKAVHVVRPDSLSATGMSIMPDIMPGFQGIALPETGGKVNISCGVPRNGFADIAEELKSDDYKVVSEYLKNNFKAFDLVDYDDYARQWVGQRWNQTGMVHCNFYHSVKVGVVIMGDAAHATSPSIGMGMNTALRDAHELSRILKECDDDLSKALPLFSEERVKEGNSLSDLAMHLYCMDKFQQTKETIHMLARGFLHKKLPSLVSEHPQSMIGRRGLSLSAVYDHAVKVGIMNKHRVMNDKIRRDYFENKSGMAKESSKKNKNFMLFLASGLVLILATGIGHRFATSY